MTTEEMFQLLLNKVDTNHTEVKAEIARLEAKLDGAITDIKELKTDVAEIKADVHLLKKLDEIDTLSINAACNDVKEIKEKVNNLDKQSNIVRLLDKSVPSLQVRVSDLEDDVMQIKKQLVKVS
jgi:phage shock protein A